MSYVGSRRWAGEEEYQDAQKGVVVTLTSLLAGIR
jgi:hypothetical protein